MTWIDNVKRKLGYTQQEAEKKWSEINAPNSEDKGVGENGTNVIKILGEINEAITKNKKNKPLTPEQIEGVIEWMNEWKQLKGTAIPIRFKEDFSPPRTVSN